MGIIVSTLFRVVVHDKIGLIFEAWVHEPLVFRRHGMRLHPTKSTRSTQHIGDISSPAGMCEWVLGGRRPWHDRLVGRISNLRNKQPSPTSIIMNINIHVGAK